MSKKFVLVMLIGCAAALVAWAGSQRMLVDGRVVDAGRLIEQQRWREARSVLRSALRWQPDHAQGNLLMAEALVIDPLLSVPGDYESDMESIAMAIDYLGKVPAQSQYYPEAKFRSARLKFFAQRRAGAAIKEIDELLESHPERADALTLKFQMMSMLGRAPQSQEYVWQAADLLIEESLARLLRDWYLIEFYHYGATKALDEKMGVLAPGEETGDSVLPKRYLMFRNAEPESSLGYVALARWFQTHADPEGAQDQLDEALEKSEDAQVDPLLFATAVAALNDLGRIQEAKPLLDAWPGDRDDYEYWRAVAIYAHRADGDLNAAESAYRKALSHWPGQIDWGTRNMLAACLREAGKADEAVIEAERAAQVERLMHDDVQDRVFIALSDLNDPNKLKIVKKFYSDLELTREAEAWQSVIDWLESEPSVSETQGVPASENKQ